MPRRTNDFQELITLLTQIIGKDVATPSAMLTSKIPGVSRTNITAAQSIYLDSLIKLRGRYVEDRIRSSY